MQELDKLTLAGQSVYSKKVLSIYDLWVLGFSNTFLWKCPTKKIAAQFSKTVSDNHLDVGVGTGYYLKHHLPDSIKRIGLMDLNENCLVSAEAALDAITPETYRHNIFEPPSSSIQPFDSISLNYVLHCLPGTLAEKSIVFSNLSKLMSPGAVLFGSTILGKGTPMGYLARSLQRVYNHKKIFSNQGDDLASLEHALSVYFAQYRIEMVGSVALFYGQKK